MVEGEMDAGGTAWDRRFAEHQWSQTPDPMLPELADPLGGGRALDLGCGPGRNAIWLAQHGFSVTGVDNSKVALQQARERALEAGVDLDLVEADLTEYRPPPAHFDLVVMAHIHPGPDLLPAIILRSTAGLRAGGHLFVIGHHLSELGHDGPPREELLYTEERLLAAVPNGLEIERLETVARQGTDHGEERQSQAVLLWATRRADPSPH